jgi:hypothetical protein
VTKFSTITTEITLNVFKLKKITFVNFSDLFLSHFMQKVDDALKNKVFSSLQ